MSKIKYLFLVLIILSSLVGFSQEEVFDKGCSLTTELEMITNLIHYKIDSLRARKKLIGLKNNDYLTKAALLHVDWINKTGKFSHFQNKSKTKTPQKRVELFGGNSASIGENIAYTLYSIELKNKKGKKYSNLSYEAIANDLVQMWIHSKGHYRNIITKEYKTTGIAIAVNLKKNTIYAVQVFGIE